MPGTYSYTDAFGRQITSNQPPPSSGGAPRGGLPAYTGPRGAVTPAQLYGLPDPQRAINQATEENAGPQAAANTKILENQAATSAPGYMSAADRAASDLALRQLAETTRANQAGETNASAQTAEATRANQAGETLATNKFNQTVADRKAAMDALGALWGGTGTGGTPVRPIATTPEGPGFFGPSTIDPATVAENAALTSAKERGGERLASSLTGLRQLMADRGIGGSGIEAKNTRELFGDYLHDQNDTERGLIQQRAQRAYDRQNAQWQRGNEIEDRNFAAQQEMTRQKIQALLASFGMTY